ncbi:MAG: RidA family protein [Fibrobacter sp.]|nr:RidA family protein [Fibrobacter sp.]
MQNIKKKVEEMGLTLPAVAAPLAAYVPATRAGDIIFVSGQLPSVNGDFSAYCGMVPTELSPEKAKEGAAICLLNNIAAAMSMLNEGETLKLVQMQGFVQSTPEFKEQPAVLNGASELAVQILGENGKHARIAVGVAALPKNAGVEVGCTFQAIKA